jgi:hypothetical protein
VPPTDQRIASKERGFFRQSNSNDREGDADADDVLQAVPANNFICYQSITDFQRDPWPTI